MKNYSFMKIVVYQILLAALILSACQGRPPQPTETPTPTLTPTETPHFLATRPAATIEPGTPEPTLKLFPTFTPAALVTDVKKIDIGGRKLNLVCLGGGSKTVVFDSDLGADSQAWSTVMQMAPGEVRLCAYDRAGLGASDPTSTPRTSQQMADDLKALLSKGHVAGPFILVAHGMASFDAILYAHKYPHEVAAIILVDGSHPDQYARSSAILPTAAPDDSPALAASRSRLTGLQPAQNPEGLDFDASAGQVRAVKSLGGVPLAVVSRHPLESIPGVPPEVVASLEQDWTAMQNELAALSSASIHTIAGHAGHNIPGEEPELVAAAISNLLSMLK